MHDYVSAKWQQEIQGVDTLLTFKLADALGYDYMKIARIAGIQDGRQGLLGGVKPWEKIAT